MKGGLFLLLLVLILATWSCAEMRPTNEVSHCKPSTYVEGQPTNVVDGNVQRFEQIESRLKAIEEVLYDRGRKFKLVSDNVWENSVPSSFTDA